MLRLAAKMERALAAVAHFTRAYNDSLAQGGAGIPASEICSECGGPLVHVAGPNVTATLCPVCDADSSALDPEPDGKS
jgi:uncharacterized Zn finger protein (UPF0148 family)